jgi:uncharacterized protein YneF (UPF0154 family)
MTWPMWVAFAAIESLLVGIAVGHWLCRRGVKW